MLLKIIFKTIGIILSITKTICHKREYYPYTTLSIRLDENTNLVGLVSYNSAYFGIFDNIVFNSSVNKAIQLTKETIKNVKNSTYFGGIYSVLPQTECNLTSKIFRDSKKTNTFLTDDLELVSMKELGKNQEINGLSLAISVVELASVITLSAIMSYFGLSLFKILTKRASLAKSQLGTLRLITSVFAPDGYVVSNSAGSHYFLRTLSNSRRLLNRASRKKVNITSSLQKASSISSPIASSIFRQRTQYYDSMHNLTFGNKLTKVLELSGDILVIYSDLRPFYVFRQGLVVRDDQDEKYRSLSLKEKCQFAQESYYILYKVNSKIVDLEADYIYYVRSSSCSTISVDEIDTSNKNEVKKYISFSSIQHYDIIGVSSIDKSNYRATFRKNPNYRKLLFND